MSKCRMTFADQIQNQKAPRLWRVRSCSGYACVSMCVQVCCRLWISHAVGLTVASHQWLTHAAFVPWLFTFPYPSLFFSMTWLRPECIFSPEAMSRKASKLLFQTRAFFFVTENISCVENLILKNDNHCYRRFLSIWIIFIFAVLYWTAHLKQRNVIDHKVSKIRKCGQNKVHMMPQMGKKDPQKYFSQGLCGHSSSSIHMWMRVTSREMIIGTLRCEPLTIISCFY